MLLFLSQQSSIGIDHHLTMSGAQRRNARNVRRRRKHSANPFIGTAGYGHCTPGAHAPFGMITIAPLSAGPQLTKRSFSTLNQGEYSAGYQHKDKFFRGMAHTATSGAGIVLGLDLVVSPFRGLGAFEDERATPGYYAATLTDGEPTQHAMERARRGHTLRFQALKRKARAMLRARRLAREAAKAVREARLRGENVTYPPPPPPSPSPVLPPLNDQPLPPSSPLPRVTAEFAAGIRYGIHRYTFEQGPPRLYFRDVSITYVPIEAARGRAGAANTADSKLTPSSEDTGDDAFVPRCAIEGATSAKSPWASYPIFMYAELSAECNQTAAALEASSVAAQLEARRREAMRKAIEYRNRRARPPKSSAGDSYEDRESDHFAEQWISRESAEEGTPTAQLFQGLIVQSHLQATLPPVAAGAARTLEMHVAISYVDVAGARRNFAAEKTSWRRLRARTQQHWESAMGTVAVDHHTKRESFRHSFLLLRSVLLIHLCIAPALIPFHTYSP